jgi:hypothetical protein
LCRYIVLCIDALGKVAGISEEFLGATVLAWGNCVGDLMSNLAVARAGQAPMAGGGGTLSWNHPSPSPISIYLTHSTTWFPTQ